MPTLTFTELRQFMADDQYYDMNEDDDRDAGPLDLLTEMSAPVKELVNAMGLTWTTADVTFVDAQSLERISELVGLIQWCFNNIGLATAKKLWETLGLHGDDDYDYSAGFIAIIVDYITTVAKRKGVL